MVGGGVCRPGGSVFARELLARLLFDEQRNEIAAGAGVESGVYLADDGVDVTGRELGKLPGQTLFNLGQDRVFGCRRPVLTRVAPSRSF